MKLRTAWAPTALFFFDSIADEILNNAILCQFFFLRNLSYIILFIIYHWFIIDLSLIYHWFIIDLSLIYHDLPTTQPEFPVNFTAKNSPTRFFCREIHWAWGSHPAGSTKTVACTKPMEHHPFLIGKSWKIMVNHGKSRKIMEKSWKITENHGKSRKIMEKSRKIMLNHGKSRKIMEKSWKIMEKSWKITENHGKIMENHGKSWKNHGKSRRIMEKTWKNHHL